MQELYSPQNRAALIKLVNTRMPFGRYKDRLLIDLPEPYVLWFSHQGFPKGELGRMFQILLEIKINGLEPMLRQLIDGETTKKNG